MNLCPLCGRELGTIKVDKHHLIPATFKGRDKFLVHQICHRKIHSTFTERELLNTYHTWDSLKGHEAIQTYIKWVAKKPSNFYQKTKESNRKRGR